MMNYDFFYTFVLIMTFRTAPLVPLAPFTLCLVIGILMGSWLCIEASLLPVLIGIVLVAICVRRWPMAQSILLMLSFVLLGMIVMQLHQEKVPKGVTVEAIVVANPIEKPKTMAVELLIPSLHQQARYYVWKDERSRQLMMGDAIVLQVDSDRFVRSREWQSGGEAYQHLSGFDKLRVRALYYRQQLLGRYRTIADDDQTYAVLAAMTLGDKSTLSDDVKDVYSVTGASHVLALSGLHLGIIYMLLSVLLAGRRRFWLSQVVIILSIWSFAFLTGLSTSIVRSATMISIYGLLSVGGRNRSSLNVLCFTAIVMLLFSPQMLFDVGFQLSFMAVLSILLFMPLLGQMVSVRFLMEHPVWRWLWSTIAVSLTAQIGVAPLIAYYFGRFSTYFLLTNLFVLPLATLILYGALLFLLTSWTFVGNALLAVVALLNSGLGIIASLPLSSIDGLHLSVFQVSLIYTIIICIYIILLRLTPSRKY